MGSMARCQMPEAACGQQRQLTGLGGSGRAGGVEAVSRNQPLGGCASRVLARMTAVAGWDRRFTTRCCHPSRWIGRRKADLRSTSRWVSLNDPEETFTGLTSPSQSRRSELRQHESDPFAGTAYRQPACSELMQSRGLRPMQEHNLGRPACNSSADIPTSGASLVDFQAGSALGATAGLGSTRQARAQHALVQAPPADPSAG